MRPLFSFSVSAQQGEADADNSRHALAGNILALLNYCGPENEDTAMVRVSISEYQSPGVDYELRQISIFFEDLCCLGKNTPKEGSSASTLHRICKQRCTGGFSKQAKLSFSAQNCITTRA